MAAPDPHKLVMCPYNPAHQVEHYKIHLHIRKCQNQHKTSKKVTCPFDATHVVDAVELDYHVSVCPKRILFDSQAYVVDDGITAPAHATLPEVATSEDWEEDNVTSYVPDPSKVGSHIIKKVKGATPSERRKARMQGVKTFRPLQDQ